VENATNNLPNALVWLDSAHALFARAEARGTVVTEIERQLDAEPAFLLRVARKVADCDRLVVMGPDASRIAFEREYVALYRRPDRLVDVGVEIEPKPRELVDRLRYLAPPASAAAA
jgi:hypothetical protein